MRYFKNDAGEVFAFDESDVEEWAGEKFTELTAKEIEAHLNPPAAILSKEDVETLRLQAYADPMTGSDRYFSEAMRMQIMGEEGYEEVRAQAVSRFEAIQRQYAWPL